MTTPHQVTISVRGEASRLVDPDSVIVAAAVSATTESISDASERVAAAERRLLEALAQLGGVAWTIATSKEALTWSATSLRTGVEYTKTSVRRYQASVQLTVSVRRFDLLPRVSAALTADDEVSVYSVRWRVDDDNPQWGEVRTDAVYGALRKGGDYASALGGSVAAVDHVADPGLLAGEAPVHSHGVTALASRASGAVADSDVPSLDPVPQEIRAVIEARLRATTGDLGALTGS